MKAKYLSELGTWVSELETKIETERWRVSLGSEAKERWRESE